MERTMCNLFHNFRLKTSLITLTQEDQLMHMLSFCQEKSTELKLFYTVETGMLSFPTLIPLETLKTT